MSKLRLAAVAVVFALLSAVPNLAQASWAGSDPSSNLAVNPVCSLGAAACTSAAIQYLDEARTRFGEPPYRLPSNFIALGPAEQAFVLVNLDRLLYGLRPVAGLTPELDQVAASAAAGDRDPVTNAPDILALTANWGGGYSNMPLAYEAWMYDDGPGSDNTDCLGATSGGCWGHRHDILWRFGAGPLAMGAAAATDAQGVTCDATLIVELAAGARPTYSYTWSQAVAAGAGSPGVSRVHARLSRVGRRHRHRRHRHRRRAGGAAR